MTFDKFSELVNVTLIVFEPPGDMVSVIDSGDQVIIGAAGEDVGVSKTTAKIIKTILMREKIIQKGFCLIKEIILSE
ncbi:MAG: hypothetical protein ABIA11_01910 [Patescibacteria group bacterium]